MASVLILISASFVGGCLLPPDEDTNMDGEDLAFEDTTSEISISSCTTINNVQVNIPQPLFIIFTDYWYSDSRFTTGCGAQSDIKVATGTMHGPTCASLRVRLFPSSGGEIVPRGYQFVCPSSGFVQLANFILPGTRYRVEDALGPAVVTIQH